VGRDFKAEGEMLPLWGNIRDFWEGIMEDLGGTYGTVPNSVFLMYFKLFSIDFRFSYIFIVRLY